MSEVVVTVVYAQPEQAIEIEVRLRQGATVDEAIDRSGIAAQVNAGGAAGQAAKMPVAKIDLRSVRFCPAARPHPATI